MGHPPLAFTAFTEYHHLTACGWVVARFCVIGAGVIRHALAALAASFICSLTPAAAGAATIQTGGPIQTLTVGEDAACQVSYGNASFEFFPPETSPGDCAPLVSIDGELFGPDFPAHGVTATDGLGPITTFEPLHQSGVSGTGSPGSPFVVETTVNLPGAESELTTRMSLVAGTGSFRVDLTLRDTRVSGGEVKAAKLYWAGDCYASGSDIGYGFVRPEARSVGCSQNPDNVPAARTIQLLPRSPNSHFMEAQYRQIWEAIGTHQQLPDTCRCSESIDNGVALSWGIGHLPAGTQTRSLEVAFTESVAPAAPADTDGDALPDSWETGTGGALDDENLAALGADPNRKDIFVHADWMEGCGPPTGWEKAAVADFKSHGVALHIDQGAQSTNADGTPWGTRSRAGQVPYQAELPNPVWSAVDAIKDAHFVAADRRRAFHYLLFADTYRDSTNALSSGGLSRGIPDSDVLIANCNFVLDLNGQKNRRRGDATMVIHELGHNLGLFHGGFESQNYKLNYTSVMNYSYAYDAIVDRRTIGYSTAARPDFDENTINERSTYKTPIAWWCPGGTKLRAIDAAGTRSDLDFNCNGTTREDSYSADITKDGLPTRGTKSSVLLSQGDWNENKLRYTGGGIIGALQLPPRNDPPVVPEFTPAEVSAHAAAAAAGTRAAEKRLLVRPTPRSIRRGPRRLIRVVVLAAGKPVRGARVRLSGAVLPRGRRYAVTNRRGVAVLRVKVTARRRMSVSATRPGRTKGKVILTVVGR